MVLDKIKRSKGFLTKKGGFLDIKEWHTVVTSGAAMAISPALWIIFSIKLSVDENRQYGSFAEYSDEIPYWIATGLATGLITGFSGRIGLQTCLGLLG